MRAADYIADFVQAQGVREIFMLSGTGSIYLDDAFASHPDIAFYCARHEGAAAMMAVGNAKLSGRLGVAVVTTGPGGVNAAGGVVEAWVDSVPILVLSGQVDTRHLANTRSFGVQGFDIVTPACSFTKYAARVTDPLTIRRHLEHAIAHAWADRPGPVWLDISTDVQAAEITLDSLEDVGPIAPSSGGHSLELEQQLDNVAALLGASERPLVIVGQGVRQAGAEPAFRRLINTLGAPVVASRLAQDLLPYGYDRYLGQGGIRGRRHTALAMRRCDLVVSLGCSLSHAFVGEDFDCFDSDATIVMVDIDLAELTKPGVHVDVPIQADVAQVIDGLLARWPGSDTPDWGDWIHECRHRKDAFPVVLPEQRRDPINSFHFVERLEAHTDKRHVFVSDAGGSYYVTGQALSFDRQQREVTSGTFASMGVALPLAVGASASDPNLQVLVITGDGSIETNIQELRTISQYELDIKVFILNNGGYASIRESQNAMCGGRYTDAQAVLDFAHVAKAFELPFCRIENSEALDMQVEAVLSRHGPELIEVICNPNQEMTRSLPIDKADERAILA